MGVLWLQRRDVAVGFAFQRDRKFGLTLLYRLGKGERGYVCRVSGIYLRALTDSPYPLVVQSKNPSAAELHPAVGVGDVNSPKQTSRPKGLSKVRGSACKRD